MGTVSSCVSHIEQLHFESDDEFLSAVAASIGANFFPAEELFCFTLLVEIFRLGALINKTIKSLLTLILICAVQEYRAIRNL